MQVPAQNPRRGLTADRQFINDPGFHQGELTVQQTFAQDADLRRVKPVEGTQGLNLAMINFSRSRH